jgi:hypothetical protein
MAYDYHRQASYSYDRTARKKAKRVDVQIDGWGGKRVIPKKEIMKFIADLKGVPQSGFSVRGPTVQLWDTDLPKLLVIVKKHGLRAQKPVKAQFANYDRSY